MATGELTASGRTVLAVDDDESIRRYVARTLQPLCRVEAVSTVAEAFDAVDKAGELAAAIVDIGLPDGSGLEVASGLRQRFPRLPLLILTGRHDPRVINRVHALGAEYVSKPDFGDNLRMFLRRVLLGAAGHATELREAVEVLAARFGLSPRESQIVALASTGVPRGRLSAVMGVSENTIKTQIRSLLEKCDQLTLADVVWQVHSESTV